MKERLAPPQRNLGRPSRRRRWMLRALRLAICATFLVLAASLAFETAVRFRPYPPGLERLPPESRLILDRNDRPLAAFAASDGRWFLPLDESEISPHLLKAIVAVEDARFAEHHGVDWPAAIAAAKEDLLAGHVKRGGSTLTMQLQRLRDPRPRGFTAKFVQAVRARQIERMLSKDQILVEYLNRAPFGGGLVGAAAASWRYFGKPCKDLSLGEAALLAGLPQNPNRLRPDRFPQAARTRRRHVLDRMAAVGEISQAQLTEANAEPLTASWRPLPQDRAGEQPVADGALSAVLSPSTTLRARGRPPPQPSPGIPGEGADAAALRVTIDADVQRTACGLAIEQLRTIHPSGVNAVCVVILDNRSAECRAAVSLEAKDEKIVASKLDLTQCPRSTGSVLKPFIYAAAFDAGIATPQTILRDEPSAWAGYLPANYDRTFGGEMTAAEALARSRNIPALALLEKVGVERAIGVMDAAGFVTLANSRKSPGLSLAIGGADATPMEVAQAYATLARGGATPTSPPPILRPAACIAALRALADRDRTAALCQAAADTHAAWKTGTSSGHRDAWCAAATPDITAVVWFGNPGGQGTAALVGQEAAAPLALQLIAALDTRHADWPATDGDLQKTSPPLAATRLIPPTARLAMVSPAPEATIVFNSELAPGEQRVPLLADWRAQGDRAPPPRSKLFWFVDGELIGVGRTGERSWWTPIVGNHEIRASTEGGQSAAAQLRVMGAAETH